ncbi:hypothetical protein AVEN_103035-1, partial [Araneus ventricosus]
EAIVGLSHQATMGRTRDSEPCSGHEARTVLRSHSGSIPSGYDETNL